MKNLLLAVIVSLCCSHIFAGNTMYDENKLAINLTPTQSTFVIKLKSNPTTGYRWFLKNYKASLVQPVKHEFIANTNKKLIGAPGYEVWTFKVKTRAFTVPQLMHIKFVSARPWEIIVEKPLIFQIITSD